MDAEFQELAELLVELIVVVLLLRDLRVAFSTRPMRTTATSRLRDFATANWLQDKPI